MTRIGQPFSVSGDLPRLVAVIPSLDPITGGVQADLAILQELQNLGWNVEIIPFSKPHGPTPYNFHTQLGFNLKLIRRFLSTRTPTIVLEDQGLSAAVLLLNLILARRASTRVVMLTYHLISTLWRHPLKRFIMRMIEKTALRSADVVLVSSESTKRDVEGLGVPSDRVQLVPLAPSLPVAAKSGTEHLQRKAEVRLLSVGTIEPRKGLRYLLLALAELRSLPWRLDVAGNPEPRHHSELLLLSTSLGLDDRVQFHGRISDDALSDLMKCADVFVQPSIGEGFGIAVLEAMQQGLPVVTTAAGALPELVEDGISGLLVEPRNPGALSEALRRLISDQSVRERLGREAGRRVRDRYSWEKTGRRVHQILSAL